MAKVLIVEPPNQGEQEYPWNEETRRLFTLSPEDAEYLESDRTMFRNDVAFTLEDLDS